MRIIGVVLVAGIFALAVDGQAQTPASDSSKLTARELFYAAPDTAKQPVKGPAKPQAGNKRAPSATQTTPPAIPANLPAATTESKSSYTPQQSSASSTSAPLIAVSDSSGPLGLRYTILQQLRGQSVEVTPDTVFHSGDRIRFRVEANGDGYLYIVQQGTSGTWSVLFPSPEIENGDNRVHRGRKYTVPSEEMFSFEGDPGIEKLFVVLSRQPEKELDSLFYSLQQQTKAPDKAPAAELPARMMLASNNLHIGNDVISRLRNDLASRDLIIEKASDGEPAAKGDKGVYVVNPNGSAAARVVADVPLTHR
jgi:hypothetical protein